MSTLKETNNRRMGGIIEDALTVQNSLPWIEDDEDIINFMRKIPLNKSYLRIPIAIKHFLEMKDQESLLFEQEIESDAKDIVSILPTCPFQEILKQLKILGNIPNRKEVALRLLLNGRDDLYVKLIETSPELDNRKRPLLPKTVPLATFPQIKVRKLGNFHNEVSGNFGVLEPSKVQSLHEKIVQPASSSFPDNVATNNLPVIHSVPAMAEQVPDIFQSAQEMPEPRFEPLLLSQPSTSKTLPDSTASLPSSSSDLTENQQTVSVNKISKQMAVVSTNNFEAGSRFPVDLSRAGPSKANWDDILIDLVEDEIHQEIFPQVLASQSSPRPEKGQSEVSLIEIPPFSSRTPAQEDFTVPIPNTFHTESLPPKKRNFDEKLALRLIEIFPDTCSEYIRDICHNKQWSDFDDLVTIIIENENHPKRQQRPPSPAVLADPEEQFETVKALLPDADPTYLRMKCDMLGFNPEELNKFIVEARDKKDYPTMKDYLRNQQLSAQSKQYTTEFCTEKFVEIFPDPHNTFNDPARVINIDHYSQLYIKQFFQNKFDRLPLKIINNILKENNFKIIQSNNQLVAIQDSTLKMKSRRKPTHMVNHNISNIPVLQELAYLEHQEEIENFLKAKKQKDEEDRQYAKNNGLMKTCQCCFDDEVMPNDTFYCPKECLFCRSCIRKSCEIAFGEGKTNFMCLSDCGEEFSLQTLKSILMPKMFSKIAQKKMIAEIKAAGIEDLETCPFCDFASIPNEQDKIFKCLNPDCMKESCRNCKEPNHVPLHCDEIEKDENVKARVFLENKMTEALLCKCWKCGTSFFKEEGCNKMTCTCGAQMCYVCKQPVRDYTHFNGMGGDKYHLCPLYSDTNNLNKQKVLHAVEEAKAQIDQSKLKVDPANDLQQYFEHRAQNFPHPPHPDVILNLARRHILLGRGRQRHRH